MSLPSQSRLTEVLHEHEGSHLQPEHERQRREEEPGVSSPNGSTYHAAMAAGMPTRVRMKSPTLPSEGRKTLLSEMRGTLSFWVVSVSPSQLTHPPARGCEGEPARLGQQRQAHGG